MKNKRDKTERINPVLEKFIRDYPHNHTLQSSEILLAAFAVELALQEIINEDEFFGLAIAITFIKAILANVNEK